MFSTGMAPSCSWVKVGRIYFIWSEGGRTGPDYAVAYALADSPMKMPRATEDDYSLPSSSPMKMPKAGVVTSTSAEGSEQPAELQAITR
jgi:hypothetical protein